jgi:DNA-binding NtrC family response regulator
MARLPMDSVIRSRIQAFAVELAELVKRAAVEEIRDKLGGDLLPRARRKLDGDGRGRLSARAPRKREPSGREAGVPLNLEHYERMAIRRALAENDGDIREAGSKLGMSKSTIYRRMMILGIPRKLEPSEEGASSYLVTPEPVSLDEYERLAIRRALDEAGGDRVGAARLLQVGKSTLYRKMARLGLG